MKKRRSRKEIEDELLRSDENYRRLYERLAYHKAKLEEERRRAS